MSEKDKKKVRKIIDQLLLSNERLQKMHQRAEEGAQKIQGFFAKWDDGLTEKKKEEEFEVMEIIDKLEGLAADIRKEEDVQMELLESIPEDVGEDIVLEEALQRLPKGERLEMEKKIAEFKEQLEKEDKKIRQYIS